MCAAALTGTSSGTRLLSKASKDCAMALPKGRLVSTNRVPESTSMELRKRLGTALLPAQSAAKLCSNSAGSWEPGRGTETGVATCTWGGGAAPPVYEERQAFSQDSS